MSDTPRTDMMEQHSPVGLRRNSAFEQSLDFCRQLERELNTANQRISNLNDYVAALETAGDEMANELSYGYDVDLWKQAKEAKP